jgi:hypothetical protein
MIVPELPKFKYKNDSYARKRGAPAMLSIFCSTCQEFLMCYQKDGPGPLLRCYLDRIHYPEKIKERQYATFSKNSIPKLECGSCNAMIGVPIIYEKEDRPAYHLKHGSFIIKKLYQGKKLKEKKAC